MKNHSTGRMRALLFTGIISLFLLAACTGDGPDLMDTSGLNDVEGNNNHNNNNDAFQEQQEEEELDRLEDARHQYLLDQEDELAVWDERIGYIQIEAEEQEDERWEEKWSTEFESKVQQIESALDDIRNAEVADWQADEFLLAVNEAMNELEEYYEQVEEELIEEE